MSMNWSQYCKTYSEKNGVTYKQAMSDCKDLWKNYKQQQTKKQGRQPAGVIRLQETPL